MYCTDMLFPVNGLLNVLRLYMQRGAFSRESEVRIIKPLLSAKFQRFLGERVAYEITRIH